METVQLTSYDGVRLAADLYVPADAHTWAPAVIVCHGFGSSRKRHAAFGEQASAAGFLALIPDLRGHGESGGEFDANIFNDVAAAWEYLQGRPETSPTRIAVRGSSMGGWLALHTAARLADISPVVAFCPVNELLLQNLVEEVGMVQRGHVSERMSSRAADLPRVNVNSVSQLLYKLDVYRAARHIAPRPLLLVHSEQDEVVPAHISEKLYADALEPKTLWLLTGGDHNFAQHDQATNARVLDWLAACWESPE